MTIKQLEDAIISKIGPVEFVWQTRLAKTSKEYLEVLAMLRDKAL